MEFLNPGSMEFFDSGRLEILDSGSLEFSGSGSLGSLGSLSLEFLDFGSLAFLGFSPDVASALATSGILGLWLFDLMFQELLKHQVSSAPGCGILMFQELKHQYFAGNPSRLRTLSP